MELLKIAQYCNNISVSEEKRRTLLKEVNVNYFLPDTLPGKPQWAGYTSLHFAVQSDDLDLTEELLNQGVNMVKQGTNDGRTPLHIAVDNSDIYKSFGRMRKHRLINTLLTKQVETNKTINPKCNDGVSHLHIACMVNHVQAVEFFAKAKVPLDQPVDEKQFKGFTPLHYAILYSSVKSAEMLIQHGADVHIKNSEGMSCLHLLVERLLDMSDYMTMGYRSLCLPYEEEIERLKSIVKFVLKANDEAFVDDSGLSAFHVACTLGEKSIVEGYLKRRVDLNKPVKSGSKLWPAWTPLHFAACIDIEIMLLLMESGANVRMKNLKGETSLDLCAKRFTPADIKLILSKEDELKDIVLTDKCTKLSDLLIAMNDSNKFGSFLETLKDVNVTIPLDSSIWPGYNLLHLSVSLKERTKYYRYYQDFEVTDTKEPIEHYNCTEDEVALYDKRIDVCLKYSCSVNTTNINGQTPIHLAFNMKTRATVEKLLSSSQVAVVDQDGLSHLHIACALGHLDVVKRYVSRGADLNSRMRTSFDWKPSQDEPSISVKPNSTPLHVAVLFSHRHIVHYLLENGADVYATDSLGRTPIHSTSSSPYWSLAKSLLAVTKDLRDSVSPSGLSHLHVATWADDQKAIEDLLRNGVEIDRVVGADVRFAGKTALLLALDNWADEIVEILLKAGANVYVKDSEGVSVLQHALRDMSDSADASVVRLVKSGELEVESCGTTPLHVACGTFDFEWAEELLKSGVDVNARIQDKDKLQGATPLFVVAHKLRLSSDELHQQFVRFVKLLLDYGADVTVECRGSTPLHLIYDEVYVDSWSYGNIDEMALVLRAAGLMLKSQKSYDFNPINDDGVSHFHLACLRNDVETATKFLDHGVDVNASIDPFVGRHPGFTPLHCAMRYQCKEVAYLLLERGADVNAEDVKGNTPLHVALKNKFVDLPLIEAMLNRGADIHAKNVNEETLLYCLLGYGGLTHDALQFYLDRGCSINILDATNDSNQGILGLAILSAPRTELIPILERLVQIPEVKSAIQGGFDAIGSIVFIKENDRLTLDDYLRAIEFLVNIGCDLDHKDTDGVTTLHVAASKYNLEAVNALLQLGADINALDNKHCNCPFFNAFNVEDNESDDDATGDENVSKDLAFHVWKMRLVGLELQEPILKRLEEVEEEFSLIALLEQSCHDELGKARESEICQGLTVRDFLSELGAIAEYPRMGSVRRTIVDNYFKNTVDLRHEFPEFCGLLALQHRKALARMDLWQPAKDAIILICRIEFPDLCLEAILRYFTNSEMKLFVESAKELA